MSKIRLIAFLGILTITARPALPVETPSAAMLLQKGIYAEEMLGDLSQAVNFYQQIVLEARADRGSLAQAQYRLGMCYLKQGRQDQAAVVFRELTELFPEQKAVAGRSRRELAALSPEKPAPTGAAQSGGALSLALDEAIRGYHGGLQYEFSPDGQQVAFVASYPFDKDNSVPGGVGFRNGTANSGLYVANRDGSMIRPLLTGWGGMDKGNNDPNTPGSPRRLNLVGWAPDASRVAFTVTVLSPSYSGNLSEIPRERLAEEMDGNSELVIATVDAEGGEPRQVGGAVSPGAPSIPDIWWATDSRHLVYVRFLDGSVLSRNLDGTERELQSLPLPDEPLWARQIDVSVGGYSPDGRWLAYSRTRESRGPERDLWLLPSNGGQPLRLNEEPIVTGFLRDRDRNAARPIWSPDGRTLYYVHQGNVWSIRLNPETGLREGRVQQMTFYKDSRILRPRVIPREGSLAFGLAREQSLVKVADAAAADSPRTIARGTGATISPDGKEVFFIGEGPSQKGILAISTDDGTVREVVSGEFAGRTGGGSFSLAPDGSRLAYIVNEGGKPALYVAPVAPGDPKRLLVADERESAEGPGALVSWSPDSKELAVFDGKTLSIIPADGGQAREVGRLAGGHGETPKWSPDGKTIALLGYGQESERWNSIFLFPAEGGARQRLTSADPDGADKECPVWNPDGQRLTFFDYKIMRIREVSIDGKVSRPLFDHRESWEYCGDWSGGLYYFTGSIDAAWRTFTYDPETGAIRQFTEPPANVVSTGWLTWSKDGSRGAWTEQRRIQQVWIMAPR